MTTKTIKTILFTAIVLSMIVPVTGFNMTYADVTKIDKPTTEFVGTLKTESRQIGDFLYIKETYSSDELQHHNVDHIYREEIVPIPEDVNEQTIREFTSKPVIVENKKFDLIHEDEVAKIQKFQNEKNKGMPLSAYQQWKIVGIEDKSSVKKVVYDPKITFTTHLENWASKKDGSAYLDYDPINLIWTDTISGGNNLITKVNDRIVSQGWNDSCVYSSDLWINISGTWTKQTKHFIDNTGGTCNQYHVRAWAINNDLVIGSAHKEVLGYKAPWEQVDIQHISTSGPNYWEYNIGTAGGYYHILTGFDTSEDEAAGEFSGSCWSVSKDSHWMNNVYTRNTYKDSTLEGSAYNDGYATAISCS